MLAPNTAHIPEHRVGAHHWYTVLKHSPDASKVRGNQKTSAWFMVTSEARETSVGRPQKSTELFQGYKSPSEAKNTSAWIAVKRKQRILLLEVSSLSRSTTEGGIGSNEGAWLSQDSQTMSVPPQLSHPSVFYRGGWAPGRTHKPISTYSVSNHTNILNLSRNGWPEMLLERNKEDLMVSSTSNTIEVELQRLQSNGFRCVESRGWEM